MRATQLTGRRLCIAAGLTAILAVSGCIGDLRSPFAGRDADASGGEPIDSTRLVERDVEAPEIFQISEQGLWDGRPTLGGVWVAHPRATDPERVIIRNEANGRFVIGSLFRRDRDGSGPDLVVSSDAADALRLAAGATTALNVTALRREQTADGAALDGEADDLAIASDAPAGISASPLAAPAAPAPQPTRQGSPLDRPFVQIGIFSVQENANNTGQALRNRGLEPTIFDQSSNERRFWRVVVGPAQTSAERAAMLDTVREMGFEDAYFVSR